MTPTLLAFDTSGELWSVALNVGERVHAYESVGAVRASAHLIPAIQGLLAQAGIGLNDLHAIAFGRGPGAFTGLRMACAVAQGLALGSGKPVLAVDTLCAVAEDARAGSDQALRLWVLMDARMDEVYAAQYAYAQQRWAVLDGPFLTTTEALQMRWRECAPQVLAGSALEVFGTRLSAPGARCVAQARPRASAMLPLARRLWRDGGAQDAAQAVPLYLRDRVALTTAERDAVRLARQAAESLP